MCGVLDPQFEVGELLEGDQQFVEAHRVVVAADEVEIKRVFLVVPLSPHYQLGDISGQSFHLGHYLCVGLSLHCVVELLGGRNTIEGEQFDQTVVLIGETQSEFAQDCIAVGAFELDSFIDDLRDTLFAEGVPTW